MLWGEPGGAPCRFLLRQERGCGVTLAGERGAGRICEGAVLWGGDEGGTDLEFRRTGAFFPDAFSKRHPFQGGTRALLWDAARGGVLLKIGPRRIPLLAVG